MDKEFEHKSGHPTENTHEESQDKHKVLLAYMSLTPGNKSEETIVKSFVYFGRYKIHFNELS